VGAGASVSSDPLRRAHGRPLTKRAVHPRTYPAGENGARAHALDVAIGREEHLLLRTAVHLDLDLERDGLLGGDLHLLTGSAEGIKGKGLIER
jgi:hypothetical protein